MPQAAKLPPHAPAAQSKSAAPSARIRAGSKPAADAGEVRVLARGLSILRAFTPRNEWLSNQEIAVKTSLPRPTVSRKYRLGASVLALGFGALANMDIRVLARPLLQRLADQEDALVVLASRDAMAMVCNEVCHSSKSIFTLRVNVGSRLVLPYSAMGLALLGAMTSEEREEALRQISRSFKKNWRELQQLIEAAVEQFRRCGFCTTLGTLESGINGISVAVDTPGAPHSFTIGLAGPSFRFPSERLESDLGPKLLAIRRDLETRLAELMPSATDPR
jgi:DNA-binding IclR family transcriptional regulator